jgi:hydrogenase expression/formation protein HypE
LNHVTFNRRPTISDQPTAPERQRLESYQLSCPVPISDYPQIIMGHGGGGKLSSELVERVFLPAFGDARLAELRDSTVLDLSAGSYAFSTDSYVVQPLFFPGGSIGHLAVHGTINDLAMSGARPMWLSAGFILEEGFPLDQLQRIARDMGQAAARAGVAIVAGDTKVVERGHGDGCYINTSGLGLVPPGIEIGPQRIQSGDAVLLSGTLGDHGMAIMSVREGLEFEAPILSDTAPLHELVATMLGVCPRVRMLRDPTRGGLAASLNEIAAAAQCGIAVDESHVPVSPAVEAACELLGFDPWLVANEGKLVAIVPADEAERVLSVMRAHPLGLQAAQIGSIESSHPNLVVARTRLGASRMVMAPIGEQLPRIC